MPIHVLRASENEADDVVELVEEYYDLVDVVARDTRQQLLARLRDQRSGAWLAYSDSQLAGCILLRPLSELGPVGELKRLYVRPLHRKQGIADQLLAAAEEFAGEENLDWLYLDTKDDLQAAIAFYERNGYERCPRYNDNPQATIFMRKRLKKA